MQAYPDDYTQHHHYPAGDDDYFSVDDDNLNMDDYLYNSPRKSMQTGPAQHLPPPNHNTMSMQRSPDLWTPPPEHAGRPCRSMQRSPDQWTPPPKPVDRARQSMHTGSTQRFLPRNDNMVSMQGSPDPWTPSPGHNMMSMQKSPDLWTPPPKHADGPRQNMHAGPGQRLLPHNHNKMCMQRSPDLWTLPPNHNYNHVNDYEGYNQDNDNFTHWGGNDRVQYPQVLLGKEQHYSAWKKGNGYPAPREIDDGYRTMKHEQHPYYYEQNKAPPVWVSKGIID